MKLKISIEKKDSNAYLKELAQVDLPSRKATLLSLATIIERIKGLRCEISQGTSNARTSMAEGLEKLEDTLMEGADNLLKDYLLSSELSLKAMELLTGSSFWENQNLKPIWLPNILYDGCTPEGYREICEGWDSVDEWVISWAEIFIRDTAPFVFLQQLENRIVPEISSLEARLFNRNLKPSFERIDGAYAYCGAFYSVANTGTLDDEEIGLLLMEHVDKERVKFERLRRKFSSSEILEVATVRERISEEVRIAVWRRDGGKCARCGSRERLEYDHIIPVSKGGGNVVRNIELLCERCNRSKGAEIR